MTADDRVNELYDRLESAPLRPVWISLVPREIALARARASSGPLAGLTFAIKDNIDILGLPTTAGCPAYAYSPAADATAVEKLIAAGAIPIGKTNLDQFATGLVGTRSPYGACSSVFDARYIGGGSSAGSAVAVASDLVDFSLGTDTAGSGRVPAAFNNIVGMKPTRGLISTTGVVPACRSLDCVSIFAKDGAIARRVWETARGFDPGDPYSRTGQRAAPWLGGPFRFGVPADAQLEFFGDDDAAILYRRAIENLEALGGIKVEIDYSIFRDAAALLYSGPWVAERLAAVRGFMDAHAEEMNPVVRGIIEGARKFSAVDAFEAKYKLRALKRASEAEWRKMDVLFLPTTGTIYTHEQVASEPVTLNTNLGYYTNFVNLLDLAAVAVPAGFRPNGLPFGVSFIGPAFSDAALLSLADLYHRGNAVDPVPGCVSVAVVGAHLTGQPLNWQLTSRGARLIKTCKTAPGYRLYALAGTVPPKPGLVRDESFEGPGIELEVWAMPEDQFGGFVAAVPAPLGIGSATLDNGSVVKCFICEGYAIASAEEITSYGGWRNYLAARGSRG
jgi:allophanate hydrolase